MIGGCPSCGSQDLDTAYPEWDAGTSTENVYCKCRACRFLFAVETVYTPVRTRVKALR